MPDIDLDLAVELVAVLLERDGYGTEAVEALTAVDPLQPPIPLGELHGLRCAVAGYMEQVTAISERLDAYTARVESAEWEARRRENHGPRPGYHPPIN